MTDHDTNITENDWSAHKLKWVWLTNTKFTESDWSAQHTNLTEYDWPEYTHWLPLFVSIMVKAQNEVTETITSCHYLYKLWCPTAKFKWFDQYTLSKTSNGIYNIILKMMVILQLYIMVDQLTLQYAMNCYHRHNDM